MYNDLDKLSKIDIANIPLILFSIFTPLLDNKNARAFVSDLKSFIFSPFIS